MSRLVGVAVMEDYSYRVTGVLCRRGFRVAWTHRYCPHRPIRTALDQRRPSTWQHNIGLADKVADKVAYVKGMRWLKLGVYSEYMSPEDVPGMKIRSKGGACHTIGLHIASNRVSPTRSLYDPQATRSSKLHAAYTSLPMPKTTSALAPTFTRPQRRSLSNP